MAEPNSYAVTSPVTSDSGSETQAGHGGGNWWTRIPLYLRILGALFLGLAVGLVFGAAAEPLAKPAKLLLRLLQALAPPLILVAVIHAIMTAEIQLKTSARLIGLLVLNTVVAICIGLAVANILHPGRGAHLLRDTGKPAAAGGAHGAEGITLGGMMDQMMENVPKSLFGPLTDDGKVLGVVFIAVAFGIALRKYRHRPVQTLEDMVEVALGSLIQVLHWIIELVPLAVFGIVASIVGTKGFAPFHALGAFVVSVIVALLLQVCYYLVRIRLGSWVRPAHLLRNTRDALVMAFSTASSTITMPLTYASLKDKVGLRERSASLGSLVGANFNNDGTALYEAMSALFIAQMLGMHLSIEQQFLVVLTSIVASVGAAGIPEAGLVTMTLVFNAVGLPTEYILVLVTVDWFLDRCRTVVNVMGDMNTSCLLDGKVREEKVVAQDSPLAESLA